jgi:hypothetical protein
MYVRFKATYNGTAWTAKAEDADIFVIGTNIMNLMENVEVAANEFFRDLLPDGEKLHVVVVNESAVGAASVTSLENLPASGPTR